MHALTRHIFEASEKVNRFLDPKSILGGLRAASAAAAPAFVTLDTSSVSGHCHAPHFGQTVNHGRVSDQPPASLHRSTKHFMLGTCNIALYPTLELLHLD